MKREDIIELARKAGFVVDEKSRKHQPLCIFHTHHLVDELLERFAALVAAKARVEEREACALVCDSFSDDQNPTYLGAICCARTIRARKGPQ